MRIFVIVGVGFWVGCGSVTPMALDGDRHDDGAAGDADAGGRVGDDLAHDVGVEQGPEEVVRVDDAGSDRLDVTAAREVGEADGGVDGAADVDASRGPACSVKYADAYAADGGAPFVQTSCRVGCAKCQIDDGTGTRRQLDFCGELGVWCVPECSFCP